jgi:uncharacterized membrane protein SirB2
MKRAYWIGLVPSLLLATGIIASTVVAVLTSESGWFVLAGPVVMAFAVVGASALVNRSRGDSQGALRVALILGAVLLLAGAILALRDPSRVVMMMPVLGAGAAASVVVSHGKRTES